MKKERNRALGRPSPDDRNWEHDVKLTDNPRSYWIWLVRQFGTKFSDVPQNLQESYYRKLKLEQMERRASGLIIYYTEARTTALLFKEFPEFKVKVEKIVEAAATIQNRMSGAVEQDLTTDDPPPVLELPQWLRGKPIPEQIKRWDPIAKKTKKVCKLRENREARKHRLLKLMNGERL